MTAHKKPAQKPKQLVRRAGSSMRGEITVTEHGLAQIKADAERGLANATIADRLGIGRRVFYDIKKRDPRVVEALDTGRARLEDELTDLLLKKARGGDTVAMIYLTKARCGWRDQGPLDGAQSVNVQVNHYGSMTTPELRQRLEELQTRRAQLLGGGDAPEE